MKNREWVIQGVSFLFIILWLYTAVTKLMDVELFEKQLSNQAWVHGYANLLVWFLPIIEITAALLLMFTATRKMGMILSLALISVFTLYVGLAVAGAWKDVPCSCGGVLNQLGWKEHLWFNLSYLTLATIGMLLLKRNKPTFNRKLMAFRKDVFRP